MKFREVVFLTLALLFSASAHAEDVIKIGDSFAYSSFARFGGPYKNGWQLATEEINNAGGVCFLNEGCKRIEVISIDHASTPQQGIRMIESLVERDQVDVLAGTILTPVTNAIGSYAGKKGIPILTIWSSVLAKNGPQNNFMFSMMPVEPHALASAELAATLPIKKWALIGPDIAWGRTGNELFKEHLKKLRPDVEFVTQQWPALLKFNATAEFSALRHAKPEGIFSTLFGTDLFAFIREGQRLDFFKNKTVIATELAQRAHLNVIGKEMSQGDWYGTGYPAALINTPEHKKFYNAYMSKYGEPPELYSIAGYTIYKTLAKAIQTANTLEPKAIRNALKGLVVETPLGPLEIFANNHRANFGVWLGKVINARMEEWTYYPAENYLGKQ